jgi:hypothetical protein
MRNLDIADTRAKLDIYSKIGQIDYEKLNLIENGEN